MGQAKALRDSVRNATQSASDERVRSSTAAGQRVMASSALKAKASDLAANQQQHAALRAQAGAANDISLTIAGIRALPGMTADVEQYLAKMCIC